MIVSEHTGMVADDVRAAPVQFTGTTDPWGLTITGAPYDLRRVIDLAGLGHPRVVFD